MGCSKEGTEGPGKRSKDDSMSILEGKDVSWMTEDATRYSLIGFIINKSLLRGLRFGIISHTSFRELFNLIWPDFE